MEEQKQRMHRYGIVDFERRKYPRVKVNLPVEYARVGSPLTQGGETHDVSEGGLQIYFPEKFEIGEQLRLKLFFSSGTELNTVEVLAQVIWTDVDSENVGEYRSGVKFTEISPSDLDRLKDFLRTLTR